MGSSSHVTLSRFAAAVAFALLAACTDGRLDAFTARLQDDAAGTGGVASMPDGGTGAADASTSRAGRSGEAGQAGQTTQGPSEDAGDAGSDVDAGPLDDLLLDDFEDGDTEALEDGWWYVQHDGTATAPTLVIEASNDRMGSVYALHTFGGGFSSWGMFIGLDLPGPIFDASGYGALRFLARAEAPSTRTIDVQFLDANNRDHFGVQIELGTGWQQFVLPLEEFVYLDQEGPRAFNPANVSQILFFVLSSEDFDFWLDDVGFVIRP